MQNSKKHNVTRARWTDEEIQFLADNYGKRKASWIAKKLKRTPAAIYMRVHTFGTPTQESKEDVYTMDILDTESVQQGLDKLTIRKDKIKSDGSTAKYYELPYGAKELQHLISHKDMNAQIGEIFRACYRYGEVEHSEKMRDAKKIKFYIEAEIERLARGGK